MDGWWQVPIKLLCAWAGCFNNKNVPGIFVLERSFKISTFKNGKKTIHIK